MKDEQLTNVLRRLVSSENLPRNCKPIDLLLVSRLLLQKADEKDVFVSRATMAENLACGERTIYDSQQRLLKLGWITLKKGAHKGQVNRIGVVLDKLPLDADLTKTVVSDDARNIAARYRAYLQRQNPRRRFFKNSLQQTAFRFETLLKKCDGDKDLLVNIVNYGLRHPSFVGAVSKGPHEIAKHWKSLRLAYDDAVRAAQRKQLLTHLVWLMYLSLSFEQHLETLQVVA